jgi:hypothetical protein
VAGDQGDLLNGKVRFEKTACAFVPEVMKVKVLDFELAALAAKRRSDTPSIVGEYSTAVSVATAPLLLDDCNGVVTSDIQQRNALVISVLARVLAIPDKEHRSLPIRFG